MLSRQKPKRTRIIVLHLVWVWAWTTSCSTVQSFFDEGTESQESVTIENPFSQSNHANSDAANSPLWNSNSDRQNQNLIVRSKTGNRSVEVELPNQDGNLSELTIPVNPAISNLNKASEESQPETNINRKPSTSDREITSEFPQASNESAAQRQKIEEQLNLVASEETPHGDRSYLATMDHIKQLYRGGRYEAALLETDDMVRDYPTDPKIYEMRGTLFDRIGKLDLAIRNWKQSIRFNSNNESLKRFVEKKEQTRRGIASP